MIMMISISTFAHEAVDPSMGIEHGFVLYVWIWYIFTSYEEIVIYNLQFTNLWNIFLIKRLDRYELPKVSLKRATGYLQTCGILFSKTEF